MADDTRYAYAVARVRGMETRLLDRQWIERLLSETAEGALKALADSAYQNAVADVTRPEDIEPGLEKALADTLTTVSSMAPEPELIDLFRLRWDYRNAKSYLKASLLKIEDAELGVVSGVGTIDTGLLERAVADRDYSMLPHHLAEAAREAEDAFRDRGELSGVDHALDTALWRHTLSVARERGGEFLVDYFRTEIDLLNVRAFVRLKVAEKDRTDLETTFIPGGTLDRSFFEAALGEGMDSFARAVEYGPYGALTEVFRDWSRDRAPALELACDNILLAMVESAATKPYSIEPLVAYILYRNIEIKLVRAAVLAKLDGLERSDIEARLRSKHV